MRGGLTVVFPCIIPVDGWVNSSCCIGKSSLGAGEQSRFALLPAVRLLASAPGAVCQAVAIPRAGLAGIPAALQAHLEVVLATPALRDGWGRSGRWVLRRFRSGELLEVGFHTAVELHFLLAGQRSERYLDAVAGNIHVAIHRGGSFGVWWLTAATGAGGGAGEAEACVVSAVAWRLSWARRRSVARAQARLQMPKPRRCLQKLPGALGSLHVHSPWTRW